jgi:predicted TIM-barrel fold metal-dependent hydrolase
VHSEKIRRSTRAQRKSTARADDDRAAAMNIYDEPKIDCHVHVLDPARFPYASDTLYRPAGQEITTAPQLLEILDAYGVSHALIVGPNSGYGTDNRCLLDALTLGGGKFKGVAVVANDAPLAELEGLKAAGIVGIALNCTYHGTAYYSDCSPLLVKLAALELFVQVQVEQDQLVALAPMLLRSGATIVIDHCGRPVPEAGLDQPGFRALLELARTRRAFVKLSGYVKFSREPYPYGDARPYVTALVDAFSLDRCVWASDWPFLRAPQRVDYGPLLKLVEELFPDAASRRELLWETPRAVFGFGH